MAEGDDNGQPALHGGQEQPEQGVERGWPVP